MSDNAAQAAGDKLDPRLLKTSLILVFGMLAPALNLTMVNIAIHSIAGDLHSSLSVVQWVITGFALIMGIAVPFSGWAFNRFGGKRVYLFSLALFLVGSVFSALAWNVETLIAFRLIQGVGAGLLMPTMQTMIVQSADGRNLGQVLSIVSVIAVICPILGPVFGGLILNSLSWRWIFYVNIPLTLIALPLVWWGLPAEKPSPHRHPIDMIGILLLSPAFAALLYGISGVRSQGVSGAVLISLTAGLLLIMAFIAYALRTKKTPVIDLRLFKSRNFSISNLLLFISGIVTNGAMLLLPLYYQQVRGASDLLTGLWLIPQGVGMLLTRGAIGKLSDRIGARPIVLVSLAVTFIGTLPFAFAASETNAVLLGAALFIRGAGLGGLAIPIMATAYIGLTKAQIPDASTATRILQTIGGAFGSAILATVLQHQLSLSAVSPLQTVSNAYNVAFWWSIGFTALAMIPAFLLPRLEKAKSL
ncbi:MAG: multidrug efflux MFS transporter [Peptococcaceae bacterium]|jgi:EmrB/QacA subfamily drug resistance transporter|nr:multidrug efflux MFS transporter [Peptococcaceae bacterium]